MRLGLIVIFAVMVADLLSKYVIYSMDLEQAIVFCDYFNLVKVWNTGVSFSMFNSYGVLGTIVLVVVALAISGFLFNWMRKETEPLKIASLAMIIGGAIGNVIDRIYNGAVLDFLDFHYKNNHWPAFNLADTFICCGAFILILLEIMESKKEKDVK